MADTTDLYSTLQNVSGVTRFFAYLGRHGKSLAAAGQVTVFGNIPHQFGFNLRKQQALERDLLAGKIAIVNTPRPIIFDASSDAQVANPSVAATEADHASSGGSLADGNYKVAYTFVNAWGETTKGTSASITFTQVSTHIPRITLPALPTDADSISLYVTAAATSPDLATLRRYATGITATTYDMTAALPATGPSHPAPPTTNTTKAAEALGVSIVDNTLGTVDPSWGRFVG